MTPPNMDSGTGAGQAVPDALDPPARLFDRLRQLAGYSWDENRRPLHSSYDNWHIFGTRFVSPYSATTASATQSSQVSGSSNAGRLPTSSRTLPSDGYILSPALTEQSSDPNTTSASPAPSSANVVSGDEAVVEEAVVARISYHVLREERSFHIVKNMIQSVDTKGDHIAKPIDLLRLAPHPSDHGPLTVAIYQSPGKNIIGDYINLGAAYYLARRVGDSWEAEIKPKFNLNPPISLELFLDFAIGASRCLELIHHSQNIVHGEIRGDAFHFCHDTHKVKLVSFGSGLRSFEHGLTSSGWATLSKEIGANNKLLYISPEQTGRMPAEPDSRTDIFSLGVLFWTLLMQRPAFEGELPLDIVQGVLGRRLFNVSSERFDVPEAIDRIIQKATAKNINERYHSASGLRHDLLQVRELLRNGDLAPLKDWQVASKDVSSVFMLPTAMIGREGSREKLMKVIERVARNHAMDHKASPSRFSDGSSFSTEFADNADASSDGGASSIDSFNRQAASFGQPTSSDHRAVRNSFHPSLQSVDSVAISGDTISSNPSALQARLPQRAWERQQSLTHESKSPLDGILAEREGSSSRHTGSVSAEATANLSRQLGSAKFRRRGQCEIVTIEGTGGLGKSCLVQSVLNEARRRGYCSTAKFDKAKKTAFGPLLNLLASLFRQLWGERVTDTPFHHQLRQYVGPVWPMLHRLLGLPEHLFNTPDGAASISRIPTSSPITTFNAKQGIKRRASSPGSQVSSSHNSAKTGSTSSYASSMQSTSASQDFLRAGTSTKSIRFMNTVLDILRMFTSHKFICFCLDDLHFADDESLELITQIIAARLRMMIIITYRPEEISEEKVGSILSPPESEEYPKSGIPNITRIQLSPLTEHDIVRYVAMTLSRPEADVSALAVVLQAKTAGNPFYMREMLGACYRKKCIWYDFHKSIWRYDLNRVFEQFQGDSEYDMLDIGFITNRLKELPSSSREILGWAALVGNSFSFDLICRLVSSEFNFIDETCGVPLDTHTHTAFTKEQAVAGLQATIQACIITSSETDDSFRFAHDRYIVAANDLAVCSPRKMHYVIARTLLEYYSHDPLMRDSTASHICESINVIKARIPERFEYRRLLFDCACLATENGARPTAAKYYSNAIALLQADPWDESAIDTSYDETLQLYLRAAECYLYVGQQSLANGILATIFRCAKSALDKAPAWVIQSRIHAQSGKASLALSCLKECLKDLGVSVSDSPTYEQCDQEFEKLAVRIQSMERMEVQAAPNSTDPVLASVGAVLAEATSISWWSDELYFYHLSKIMVEMHLDAGAFPQSGMGFLHLAMVAISRFNMVQFGSDLGTYGLELLDRFRDPFSMARGYMIYASFIGHIQDPLALAAAQLEGSLEHGASAGDRVTAILGFGLAAMMRFFASEAYPDLESFCQYSCEEIPNWHQDPQGGTLLIAVRQVSKALQGKTTITTAAEIMNDEQHVSSTYKEWLKASTINGDRSLLLYETVELVPLFLYGHYDEVIEISKRCMERKALILSARNTRLVMLLYGLALAGKELRHQEDPRVNSASDEGVTQEEARVTEIVSQIQQLSKSIQDWSKVSEINYFAWYTLLDAQVADLQKDTGSALRLYEQALDHASEHDFYFEEALGNYLMAGTFIRNGARRSARSALRDAVGLFRQLGATGVANRVEEEHTLLLRSATKNLRTLDAAVQTDFVTNTSPNHYHHMEGEDEQPTGDVMAGEVHQSTMAEIKGERIGVWRGAMQAETDSSGAAGLPALDMIDLHAILQSSQIISSELRVDHLLKTMCDVILRTCGGSATQGAIVVQDETTNEWCVAASGEPEKGAVAHRPGIPLKGTSLVADNVVLYSMRVREPVFVPDLISDEQFGNVSECWAQKNPRSKSVISIPICHATNPVLGVLYLEGLPGAFTDRNVTVLQLLVNQIGISYSNALSMKAIEKVSAENNSMVALQKTALNQAREAEVKAKAAEKEAKRNVKLAEAAEAEAKRNVKLAEEATKAKSIFLANVSHELRTPLNGVIGNSELLRDSNLTAEQQEMAEAIRLSADLLLIVINDILDFSRMEAEKMKLYITAFNPKELMPEVVRAASYRNQDKTKQGVVDIIKQINLPPDLFVLGDPVRLHQVLGNLIGNSIKFTERGAITVGARVESETEQTVTLTFWVEDTGIGIPPEQLAKLFQPFSQADASTARKYGGSGLGLSICKSLIETIMKGKIYLESTENVGTRAWFTVTFDKARGEGAGERPMTTTAASSSGPDEPVTSPVATSFSIDSAISSSAPRSSQPPHPPHPLALKGQNRGPQSHNTSDAGSANPYMDLSKIDHDQIRVCIAEDNPINRKIAILYVQRLGYKTVDAYDNGQKAVEALREKAGEGKPYHIVLMDVQMPVLDGYEATKLLRKDPIQEVREVLVIAMTASAIQGDREKCLAAGMNDYLAKPVKSEVLRSKLDAYIHGTIHHAPPPTIAAAVPPPLSPASPASPYSPLSASSTVSKTSPVVESTTYFDSYSSLPLSRRLSHTDGSAHSSRAGSPLRRQLLVATPPAPLISTSTSTSSSSNSSSLAHVAQAEPPAQLPAQEQPPSMPLTLQPLQPPPPAVAVVPPVEIQEAPAKRQPKKLTKSRNSSEAVPVPAPAAAAAETTAPAPAPPLKSTPSVLQKKNKRQASVSVDNVDSAPNVDPAGDDSRSVSIASTASIKGKEPAPDV